MNLVRARLLKAPLFTGYLIFGLIAVASHYVAPETQGSWVYLFVEFFAVIAVIGGVWIHRPSKRSPWFLMAVGLLTFGIGDFIQLSAKNSPSLADLFYLVSYSTFCAALVTLTREGRAKDTAAAIDSTIVATGFGVVAWVGVVGPHLSSGLPPLQALVSVVYPVLDVLLLALSARLVLSAGRRTVAQYLILLGLGFLLAGDVVRTVGILGGASGLSKTVLTLWMLSFVLYSSAALHPSMALPSLRMASESMPSVIRIISLSGAALLAPGMYILATYRGDQTGQLVSVVAATLLFFLVLVRLVILAGQMRTKAVLLQRNEEQLERVVQQLEAAQSERRLLLERIISATEAERTRLATEIHDGPVQRLTSLLFWVDEALGDSLPDGLSLVIADLEARLQVEILSLRKMMVELWPPTLTERGFVTAIGQYLESFADASGIKCHLEADRSHRLDLDQEVIFYRVAQEALANVGKHSSASNVWIRITSNSDDTEVEICDDGCGFDPLNDYQNHFGEHFGLIGMRERIESAGGEWSAESKRGAGTTLRATLPGGRLLANA